MYYSTVYVGMDVHKENFSLCCFTNGKEGAEYPQKVEAHCSKLECFIGIKTHTALSVITETGDFKRFPDASHYVAYLGLVPGEDSSGGDARYF